MGRTLGKPIIDKWRKAANIFSTYHLCSVIPVEEVAVLASSLYTLSIAEVRLAATGLTSVHGLYNIENPKQVASIASVYDLSTAVT